MDIETGGELFVYVFLLSFGVFALLIGAATAKFGSGTSRKIGAITAVIGLIALGIYGVIVEDAVDTLIFSIVTGVAAAIGVVAGLGIFLLSIMKS